MTEMQFPPIVLVGERITLKKPIATFELAQEMFNVVQRNREHILPWLEWADKSITKTPEDSFIFLAQADKKRESGELFEYLIHDNKTNSIIGGLGVSHTDKRRQHKIEIGYWLDKESCGNGYVQEAVRLIEKIFFDLGFIRLVIRVDVNNQASRKTAEKLGYTFEGISFKDRWCGYTKTYRDMIIFSKTKG